MPWDLHPMLDRGFGEPHLGMEGVDSEDEGAIDGVSQPPERLIRYQKREIAGRNIENQVFKLLLQ
ncbi:hypothetical protein R3P38DRAFT_3183274 [Favolaschia claudopus]|uniref:Uncharacterized protein n=1 Tax=Favolaschia claudopus TaxID=2862362 RepID=A0AAW0CDW2_9AGAR